MTVDAAVDGSVDSSRPDLVWSDAALAAACIATDPAGLGGVRVRAPAGTVRDRWNALWRSLVADGAPIRSIPLHVDDGRLLGGLDLAASLRSGRTVRQPGLLAEADGGFAVLSMAERIVPETAARIATALDDHGFGLIALDEGEGDEAASAALVERLALCVDLRGVAPRALDASVAWTRDSVDGARCLLPDVSIDDGFMAALCEAAQTLGIDSMRVPLFAVRCARVLAALAGRRVVDDADVAGAARLVFASRVRRLPAAEGATDEQQPSSDDDRARDPRDAEREPSSRDAAQDRPTDAAQRPSDDREDESVDASSDQHHVMADVVVDAAVAAIPAGLLALLADGAPVPQRRAARGGAGALGRSRLRGAPAGVRRARPRAPERLSLIETLRAAAPWQAVRRAEAARDGSPEVRIRIRIEDLHVVRFRQRQPATTVFVVDASGSSALHRLAEAKGAVELLLADCYVRRDRVAVLAFRGRDVELLLPPTRSLTRARRSLAGLPGGGGTPLASALDATRDLVTSLRRGGDSALAVLLTDGRANVARDGGGGRPRAEADASSAARALRAAGVDAMLIDTSPKPHPQAAVLAAEMGAVYRPLPQAGALELSKLVNRTARDRSAARAGRAG